jgi:hypothetical protein
MWTSLCQQHATLNESCGLVSWLVGWLVGWFGGAPASKAICAYHPSNVKTTKKYLCFVKS